MRASFILTLLVSICYCAILGVDMGSELGILSVWRPGKVGVIADDNGKRKQQQMVGFDEKKYLLNGASVEKMVS